MSRYFVRVTENKLFYSGIYNALKKSGAIDDMIRRSVEHLHVYGIDNILTKSLDPNFLGVCIENKVECGNKVVWRANKSEKVGVSVAIEGRMSVLEYSEIPSNLAEALDTEGKLIFGAANICNHYMTVTFLMKKVLPILSGSYHIAYKKIPFMDPITRTSVTPTQNNGAKLEMFIFDIFPLAEQWIVMEVDRNNEFAPVKNEPGNPVDSPDSARAMISAQAQEWLINAGAILVNDKSLMCEISPLLSYGGEGLEHLNGVTISLPSYLCGRNEESHNKKGKSVKAKDPKVKKARDLRIKHKDRKIKAKDVRVMPNRRVKAMVRRD
jgi:UDP-N-acetylglucosamine/UDP-N-acetylgalactosamine diphosphorylase